MRKLFLFAAVLCTMYVHAQTNVETQPESVVVFIDGAQVTRTKTVNLPQGNSTLRFVNLSPYMDAKSMQLKGDGNFTILSVNHQYAYPDSVLQSQEQSKLEKQIADLRNQINVKQNELDVAQAEKKFLTDNSTLHANGQSTSLALIKEFASYYSSRLSQINTKVLQINNQLGQLNQELQQLTQQQAELKGKPSDRMSEVIVNLHASAATKATFELTYFVGNAGWFPSYDIRSNGIQQPINLLYKATVRQNTKEDWKNVHLTLSTSLPTQSSIAPKLQTYWLDYGLTSPVYTTQSTNNITGIVFDEYGKPLPGANVSVKGTTIGTVTDMAGQYSLVLPQPNATLLFSYVGYAQQERTASQPQLNIHMRPNTYMLEETVVVEDCDMVMAPAPAPKMMTRANKAYGSSAPLEVKSATTQTAMEFEIEMPYTLLSSNKPLNVEIGRYELPTTYLYECTPKIDKDAFLTANITDWTKLNLIDGEANVYFENTFVGKTLINTNQANDTLSISLGRDKNIVVKREKTSDYTQRKTIGANITETKAWTFSIKNTKPQNINIRIYDQLPVSTNSTIEVTAEETNEAILNNQNGILYWQIQLQPDEQTTRQLRYKIKYPKNQYLDIQ